MPSQYVITSAYRTLQVLLAFGAGPHRFSLAEMTAATGIEKNQLYRSLKTLEEAGFIRAEHDGRFALTPLVGVLASAVGGDRRASLVDVSQPFVDRLTAETGESVNLFVLAGEFAVCVDSREGSHGVRLASVLGRSVSLHAGAVPKAILAHLPAEAQETVLNNLDRYPRYTDRTLVDAASLRLELERTRARGYAISDEDFDSSARGVGAPIFDHAGDVVGGISIGGPSFRVDDAALDRFSALITRVAKAVSRQLGYTG